MLRSAGGEVRVGEVPGLLERPGCLLGDGRHLAVHIEQLAFLQAQAFDDVLEGVGVNGLLERLP